VKACLLAEGTKIEALALPDGLRQFELQMQTRTRSRFFVGDDFLIKRALMSEAMNGELMAMNFPATTSTKGPPAVDMWHIDGDTSGGWCEEGTLEQIAKFTGDIPIMFKKCSGLVPNVTQAAMSSVSAQFLKAATAKVAAVMAQHRTRLVV